jgi:hypothetical protein
MRFAGKLLYKGHVVLDPATGDLWETTMPTGVASWGGYFDPTNVFGTGTDYELILNDGRRGLIKIGSVSFSSLKPTAISFHGSGPLK